MNILQMSISGGVLILAIVFIRLLAIDRLPKTMFVTLWMIALCRLLIPFSIPSRYGFYGLVNNIFGVFGKRAVLVNAGGDTGNMVFYHGMGYADAINNPIYAEPVMLAWITGAIVLALFFTVSFLKYHREIRTALPVKGCGFIDNWLNGQITGRNVKILISDKITTPLTYGIIKPKIVLPKSMDLSNELQTRYILTHEFVHIKRFDALLKLGLIVVLCFHWFNPMVWVLYILMGRDLEIACDVKVIRLFGENNKSAYALLLISMAEYRSTLAPFYSSFSKSATRERILSIMRFRKTSVLSLILAFIIIAGSLSVFAESTAEKSLKLHGVIQTDSGNYSFDLDKKGDIIVSDAGGKAVSTASVDSNGNAVLTDGSGNVIKILQLGIPDIKQAGEKFFKVFGTVSLAKKSILDIEKIKAASEVIKPKFTVQAGVDGMVIVRDAAGKLIGTGTADKTGTAILRDSNGTQIGTASIKNGMSVKMAVNIKNSGKMNNIFIDTAAPAR